MKSDLKQMNRAYLEEIISDDFNSNLKKLRASAKNQPVKKQGGFLKNDSASKVEILNS